MSADTPPSARTRIRRIAERADYSPDTVRAILDAAHLCHIGFTDDQGSAHVIPTAYWREGDHLYVHGSNGSRLLKALAAREACVSVTLLDGLVLARSAFNHSMNYRSVVIYGQFEAIPAAQKAAALDHFMAHLAPGREREARPGNANELAATTVLRLSLAEAAAKVRTGPPEDDAEDMELPVWAGVLPYHHGRAAPQPDAACKVAPPDYVKDWQQG